MKQLAMYEEMATFAVVVEEGSFTKAAKRLKRSKAYVSQQLSRLEEALEVSLLFRTTRKLELTEAGRACIDHCQAIVKAGQDVQHSISAVRGEMSGTIRITVPVSFGEVFCRDIVFDFIQDYPDIKIELELENAQRDLIAESYDLAIRATATPQDELVALYVGDLVEIVCASQDYVAQHGAINTPQDLATHRCIINRYQADLSVWNFQKGDEVETVPVDGAVVVNHYPLAKQAALSGHGVARLPHYLVNREIQSGEIVAMLTDYQLARTPIYVVYPYHGTLPMRTRKMIDYVVAWLRRELTEVN